MLGLASAFSLSLHLGCGKPESTLEERGIPVHEEQLVAYAAQGDREAVTLLLAAGLPADGRDAHGNTPLLAACEAGRVEVVDVLLDDGADPNLGTPRTAATPLALAASRGHVQVVRRLLEAGAHLEAREPAQQMTPLAVAAFKGHREIVADLLEAGAEVHAVDVAGWSPLHHAVRQGHEEVVRLLLAAGADPRRQDEQGRSSWDLAHYDGGGRVLVLLEERPPRGWVRVDPFDDQTPHWPELASFSTARDPAGSHRILLRSPVSDQAQIFLIVGEAEAWRGPFLAQLKKLDAFPTSTGPDREVVLSADQVRLELWVYRIGPGLLAGQGVERVLGWGQVSPSRWIIVDAGGDPKAAGVAEIEDVLRRTKMLPLAEPQR